MNKQKLDERVALLTGHPVEEVAAVTSTFLRLIVGALIRGERVWIPGFGRFFMRGEVRELRVGFRRSHIFKTALIRQMQKLGGQNMEKLGVDESGPDQEQLEKRANEGCPLCGAKVERHGSVLSCPVHGTEPFEKK